LQKRKAQAEPVTFPFRINRADNRKSTVSLVFTSTHKRLSDTLSHTFLYRSCKTYFPRSRLFYLPTARVGEVLYGAAAVNKWSMVVALQGPNETRDQTRDVEPVYGVEALEEVLPMRHNDSPIDFGRSFGIPTSIHSSQLRMPDLCSELQTNNTLEFDGYILFV
jgi:hypothetical protein